MNRLRSSIEMEGDFPFESLETDVANIHNIGFVTIPVHDFMIVDQNNQSIDRDVKILIDLSNTYFNNTQFVYITHRINSYSVDPAIYKEVSKIDNLVGFSVVSKNFMAKSTAQIEKLFLAKPFEIFDTLPEAITWAQNIMK